MQAGTLHQRTVDTRRLTIPKDRASFLLSSLYFLRALAWVSILVQVEWTPFEDETTRHLRTWRRR